MGGQDMLILIMGWQMIALETEGGMSKQRRSDQFMELVWNLWNWPSNEPQSEDSTTWNYVLMLASMDHWSWLLLDHRQITAMTYRCICCV